MEVQTRRPVIALVCLDRDSAACRSLRVGESHGGFEAVAADDSVKI